MMGIEMPSDQRRTGVLLVADNHFTAASAAADVETAGARLLARVDLHEAAERIGMQAARIVLLIEMAGMPADALERQLPLIDAAAAAAGTPIIACFDEGQIDLVAAMLGRSVATLLCNPSVAERAGALALADAMGEDVVLADRVREDDTARLARLNQEVARIAEVLERISRRGGGGQPHLGRSDVADRRMSFEGAPVIARDTIDPQEIRRAIRARRLRDQVINDALFEDPAWDMMLDLFAAHLERAQVSVSSLCIAAAVPPTTALRWIGKMTEAGLIERNPDPFDKRRVFMALSPEALRRMRGYVVSLKEANLTIV